MHRAQAQVLEFHRAFGVTIGQSPDIRDAALRARLILEEAFETAVALVGGKAAVVAARATIDEALASPHGVKGAADLVDAIDGMCDLSYVTYGAAIVCGVDLEPFFDEVHRSNMAKVGGPARADGKILKPPGWRPPDIAGLLARAQGKAP